jgi:voltage-gated potassium channel Kch
MQIPLPTPVLIGWALVFAAFVMVSRFATTFAPLYLMRQGLRTSIIPAINLAQVSEFSLVILALGAPEHHLANPSTTGMVALAFTLLAAVSTFGMSQSDGLTRSLISWLKRRGLRDLDHATDDAHAQGGHGHGKARIIFLGFFRTASSLLEEMQRHAPDLIGDTAVVDFSPVAREALIERKVRVIYGDISQRDTLLHAEVEHAEVLICSVPDSVLKGTTNERLVRMLRGMNPKAQIIATAEVLGQAATLLTAGANYVSIARQDEATDLLEAVRAATEGLLGDKRRTLQRTPNGRTEVLA